MVNQRLLKTVRNIDLFDLNYSLSKPEINYIDSISNNRKYFSGFFFGILRFIASIFKSFVSLSKKKVKADVTLSEVVFFAGSLNQLNSIKPVADVYLDSTIIGTSGYGKFQLNVFLSRIYSFLYIGTLLNVYFKQNGYLKDAVRYLFDRYLGTYGFYHYSILFFKKHSNIKVLILANDHTMRCRVLNETARLYGIKTIFIQHASANKFFPPLSFDYACLDGNEARQTYQSIGKSRTKIIVTGNARLELNLSKYNKKLDNLIGLCFNPNDNKDLILEVIELIGLNFEFSKLIIRPHPNDRRYNFFKKYCVTNNILFSHSKKQNVYEFFQKVNLIIAGESNIHLESATFNTPTIYYELGNYKQKDWYGFIKKGIIKFYPKSQNELIKTIHFLNNNCSKTIGEASMFYRNLEPDFKESTIELIIKTINIAKAS